MDVETDQRTDEELIIGCRVATPERKRELVGALAERHFRGLLNYIFAIVNDRDLAEDLVQESFIRVYRSAEGYQAIAKFSTWLYRIGRNLALNEVRNRKRRPALLLNRSSGGDEESAGGEIAALIASPGLEPGEIVEQKDMAQLVRAVIATMPKAFREVIMLCDLQRLSYQECAEILGIKIGTVRSRLSRARAQFEQKLRRVLAGRASNN